MQLLSSLDVKVLRDVMRMRGQLAAIAVVIATGLGVYVGMRATMRSLVSARTTYYAHERFAHVFAGLERAPEHVGGKLEAIPGVHRIQTRVQAFVSLDVPGLTEAATGQLISLPDRGRPEVNDVRLRSGRLPEPGRWQEVFALENFVEAHGLPLGARIGAVINGRREELKIVGTALSPEFTYSLGPGLIFPDDKRFGVFWMRREALAAAFDMEGAFNDVSLLLDRNASVDEVIERVDDVLETYGGLGAIARKDQPSAFFVENELKQLWTFAVIVPALFLAVAAFLLNIVLGRIVANQREEIAAMKAFGYRDREVGLHYAKLVCVVLTVGSLLGLLVAGSLGAWMTRMYVEYYRFPELPFEMSLTDALEGIGIGVVAATLGTWSAIRRTVRLPPAEAMRPEAPPAYRPTVVERLGLSRVVSPPVRMVLREVERKPVRTVMSVAGIAMAIGLTVMNAFTLDSITHMLNVQFGLQQRQDVQLTLFEPRETGALRALEHLPGVMHAEPYRNVPVRLRAGTRSRSVSITGIPADATLHALLDDGLGVVPLPAEGLVLSSKLADILGVAEGDRVRVEVLEGERAIHEAVVARIVETFIGTTAHMELAALCRLLGETESLNGAWLSVDDSQLERLHAVVKDTPVVAGVVERGAILRSAQQLIDENIGRWVLINISFSLVLAFGVLYNAARITLAERARELASLRVLGFRRREVGAILIGEIVVVVLIAMPLGLVLGRLLAAALVESPGFDTEQFRIPLVVTSRTYALAILTVILAAVASGWSVWRRLDRVDLVEVLKSRD